MLLTDLFASAYVPYWYLQLDELAKLALPEPWRFKNTGHATKNADGPCHEKCGYANLGTIHTFHL